MIKIKKILLLLFATFLIFNASECYAKGKFVKLSLKHEDSHFPIVLNKNEIFFAGGYSEFKTYNPITKKWDYEIKPDSASIYNLETKKLLKLNSYMNALRSYKGAIKYNEDNILILGGYCGGSKISFCFNTAENYKISENKFELLEKMPMQYDLDSQQGLIQINEKVYIITKTGIMTFDTKNRKFEVLMFFDVPLNYYNAYLVDSDNILIWGGHYHKTKDSSCKNYSASILEYNISTNKINELLTINKPYWENPINAGGIPFDNKKILLSVKGNKKGGTIYIYDYNTNTIEEYGKTKFGMGIIYGIYLKNNKFLLGSAIIDNGYEPFISPTYLDYGILDLTKKECTITKQ